MSGWGGAVAVRVSSPRGAGFEVEGLEGIGGLPACGDGGGALRGGRVFRRCFGGGGGRCRFRPVSTERR